MTNTDKTINYIEFPMSHNAETKAFYGTVFGWKFTDWGPDYISFEGAGIDGGFNGESTVSATAPGILVVLYTKDLTQVLKDVTTAAAEIIKPVYDFPGGRRFHFRDPNGNELAVWSEV